MCVLTNKDLKKDLVIVLNNNLEKKRQQGLKLKQIQPMKTVT